LQTQGLSGVFTRIFNGEDQQSAQGNDPSMQPLRARMPARHMQPIMDERGFND
jgi:hypothetical protein